MYPRRPIDLPSLRANFGRCATARHRYPLPMDGKPLTTGRAHASGQITPMEQFIREELERRRQWREQEERDRQARGGSVNPPLADGEVYGPPNPFRPGGPSRP